MSSEDGRERIGPGGIALIVGPSGAGKDALIEGARARLATDSTFFFAKRIITRPAHASEAHIPMADADFISATRRGAFALSWRAHGTGYGIPIEVDNAVRAGRLAIANVSRAIIADTRRRYAKAPVVVIDCPIELRAERLAKRGRERADEILSRLQRTVDTFNSDAMDFSIDNSGPLEIGVTRLISVLRMIATSAP